MQRLIILAALLLSGAAQAQVMGKPSSPVTFNPAAFGENSTPAPDSYYHIDEGTGTTLTNIGKDAGSYDCTIDGADWETDDTSTILSFVSANTDFADCPLPGITGFPFTIAIWIELDVTGTAGDLIGIGDSSSGAPYHVITTTAADRVQVRSNDSTTNAAGLATPSGASNILNVYHLVVVAWDSNTSKRVYVGNDGSGTLTTSIGYGSTPDLMRIGDRPNNAGAAATDANVAGVAIWKNTALTASQIQTDLYNGGSWPPFVTTGSPKNWFFHRRH